MGQAEGAEHGFISMAPQDYFMHENRLRDAKDSIRGCVIDEHIEGVSIGERVASFIRCTQGKVVKTLRIR